jgi:hypothetical protein
MVSVRATGKAQSRTSRISRKRTEAKKYNTKRTIRTQHQVGERRRKKGYDPNRAPDPRDSEGSWERQPKSRSRLKGGEQIAPDPQKKWFWHEKPEPDRARFFGDSVSNRPVGRSRRPRLF